MTQVATIPSEPPIAEQLRRLADEIEAGELGFRPARGVLVLSAEVDGEIITMPFAFGCRNFLESMGILATTLANQDQTGFNVVD